MDRKLRKETPRKLSLSSISKEIKPIPLMVTALSGELCNQGLKLVLLQKTVE